METPEKNEQWDIEWRDRQGQVRTLVFELGRGLRYCVVIHDERDKERFLQTFLRPPETALLAADGGLLSNIKVDENLLLPMSYRGAHTSQIEARVIELFGRCGLDEAKTGRLLIRLPHQLSTYQRRVVGFVRSVLLQPKVMVYVSVLHGVSSEEIQQIRKFDEISRQYVPACTAVFVDYDTHINSQLYAHQTFFL